MQSRWTSRVAGASVFALVGFLLGNWGLFERIGLTDETWQTLVELVLAMLTAFGVFNNPTDAEKY